MRPWLNLIFIAIAAAGGYMAAVNKMDTIRPTEDLGSILMNAEFVDLTHTMVEEMPTGPSGKEPPTIKKFATHDDGMAKIHRYNFPGQWGTHVDPPIHFAPNTRTLEDIPLNEMILPLVVIDIHEKVENNPDYVVTMNDIYAWEEKHGAIPEKTFVALRTDWSKRWPSTENMRNRDADNISHSPGWGRDVIDYLVLSRNVTAIGHETLDTDPGVVAGSGSWPLQTYYMGLNKYQIEALNALDQVPENGAYIVATWAKPKDGSGFPARAFAIIPKAK